MKLKRRKFLKLAGSGLFVPAISRGVELPFFVSRSGVISNGLLSGTLGYWKMDENLAIGGNRADSTGNGWTATDVTSLTPSATGLINNCANINTIAKGFSVSTNIDTRAQTTPFAVSLWLRQSDIRAGNGVIAKIVSGGVGWLIYPDAQSPTSKLHWYTTTDANVVSDSLANANIDASAFNHIVAGYDGTNKLFYLNNVNLITTAVAGVNRGTNVIAFGNYSDFGVTTGVAGLFDEIAYFNFMPSVAQVNLLNNGGAGLPFSSYS